MPIRFEPEVTIDATNRWLKRLLLFGLVLLLAACGGLPETLTLTGSGDARRISVLYTNDEHGWMEPSEATGGAAGMLNLWQRDHGYRHDGPFLVLSGGDMWTGPAVSTLFEGESMQAVMNRMGYAAAAIGNHDFDFGGQALSARAEQSDFPFLSANLIDRSTGDYPIYAEPFTIRQVNGVQVGIIGLTTVETSIDTRPSHVQGLRVQRYEEVLLEVLPQVREQGADVVLIIGHICNNELQRVVDVAREYMVPLLGGGHCHEEHDQTVGDVHLIESGYFLRGYVKVDIVVDVSEDRVLGVDTLLRRNPPGPGDPEIQALVQQWQDRVDPALLEPIGYAASPIDRRSTEMDRLLTQAWLGAVPQAQIAIASRRYVQQSIAAGPITAATVVGVLPVDNQLFVIELSGEQLAGTINARNPVLGGIERSEDGLRLANGEPLEAHATYSVVVPDVIYYGANYYELQGMDSDPTETGVDWRQPVVDLIRSFDSTRTRPLDQLLRSE